MVLITIVMGVYKPTYNWGAPHCMYIYIYGYLFDHQLMEIQWEYESYPLVICYVAIENGHRNS